MVKAHRLVIVLLALAATLAPGQAQAFVPEARFDIVTPAGETPAFRDFAVDQDGFTYVLWPGLVQKYDPSGAHMFSKAVESFSPDVVDLAIDQVTGDIIMLGIIYEPIDFGGGPIGTAGEDRHARVIFPAPACQTRMSLPLTAAGRTGADLWRG